MNPLIRGNKKNETEEHGESTALSTIKSLVSEEIYLREQRDRLLVLRKDLALQAKERIETVTSSVQKLKGEVSELRVHCARLEEFISSTH